MQNNPFDMSFNFRPVTYQEVFTTLKSLDPKKAIGIDQIPPFLLKKCTDIIAGPLTNIINKSISDSEFPSMAK